MTVPVTPALIPSVASRPPLTLSLPVRRPLPCRYADSRERGPAPAGGPGLLAGRGPGQGTAGRREAMRRRCVGSDRARLGARPARRCRRVARDHRSSLPPANRLEIHRRCRPGRAAGRLTNPAGPPRRHPTGIDGVRPGLVWYGQTSSGLVYSGLVWSGLVWSGLVWSGLTWSGLVWSGAGRCRRSL